MGLCPCPVTDRVLKNYRKKQSSVTHSERCEKCRKNRPELHRTHPEHEPSPVFVFTPSHSTASSTTLRRSHCIGKIRRCLPDAPLRTVIAPPTALWIRDCPPPLAVVGQDTARVYHYHSEADFVAAELIPDLNRRVGDCAYSRVCRAWYIKVCA